MAGIDIELQRADIRYLIKVKSSEDGEDPTQLSEFEKNFVAAVKAPQSSSFIGKIQPVLGDCLGGFQQENRGTYIHVGGGGFWELISGQSDLYANLIEIIGRKASEFNEACGDKREHTQNRMQWEFIKRYCMADGRIAWAEV